MFYHCLKYFKSFKKFSLDQCLVVLAPKVRKKSTAVSVRSQRFAAINLNKGLDLSGCPKDIWEELIGAKKWTDNVDALTSCCSVR